MSTNDPPQGPDAPVSWPPQDPTQDPTAPGYGPTSWPPQQPPQQPQPEQAGGWGAQPTTQWPAQPSEPGGWPVQGPPTAPVGPYGPTQTEPGVGYYPPPPSRSSGGYTKSAWWIIGGAIAVVVVLIAAVGVVIAVRSGNGPNPASGGHPAAKSKTKVLWTLSEPPGSDIKGANALSGLWLSDQSIVRATVAGLTAYDISTGKQQWNVAMPAGNSLCQTSPTVVDGVGAVIYGQTVSGGAKCDHLLTIDAKSGNKQWSIGLHQSGDQIRDYADPFTAVSVVDGAVVAQNSDAVRAYALSNGARKWGVKPTGGATSSCNPSNARGAGDRVLVVLDCLGNSGSVTAVTAATGTILWTHTTTSTEGDPLFMDPISVKPAVLASRSLGGSSQVLVLDDSTGDLKKQISSSIGGSSALDLSTDGSRSEGGVFYHVAVKDGKLFGTTEGASGAQRNEIVAIDLSTGKATWTQPSAPGTRETLIKVDDDGVLTLNQGAFDGLPRLVRYDAGTGKGKNGVTLPADMRSKFSTETPFVQGDKIVLVATRSGPESPPIIVLGE